MELGYMTVLYAHKVVIVLLTCMVRAFKFLDAAS